MELELNFKADTYVDFAYGTVVKGKEAQVFQEYFPAVGAVLQELELRPLGSYAVLDSNLEGDKPEQGAFSFFRKVENYQAFMQDPRVKKVLPLREDGMVFLKDGNMFEATGQTLVVDSDRDYALILSPEHPTQTEPLIKLGLHAKSPNKEYQGKTLFVYNWSEETEQLMGSDSATVLRVRFLPRN